MTRPGRSDAHLSPEEEAKIEEETREYFEDIAPKRHTKPSRSEYSAQYSDAQNNFDPDSIPEFQKLKNLETNDSEKLVCERSEVVDEYVETDYYKDLNCADKQHHTTGTGFIKMDKTNEGSFEIKSDSLVGSESHPSGKGNPATNEWISSAENVNATKPITYYMTGFLEYEGIQNSYGRNDATWIVKVHLDPEP